jgi:hypothetical protein
MSNEHACTGICYWYCTGYRFFLFRSQVPVVKDLIFPWCVLGEDGWYPAGPREPDTDGRGAAPGGATRTPHHTPATQPHSTAAQANIHTDHSAAAADTQTGQSSSQLPVLTPS